LHSPKAFIYEPLDPDQDADSIRLVSIEQSANQDDPISCNLVPAKFADKPKYRALSYMWGDQAVKAEILLNGVQFYVGQNLWDALHYLRNHPNRTPLWVDAICIYFDRYETEYHKNLRFGPLFSKGFVSHIWASA
jgi:hypothetical protein